MTSMTSPLDPLGKRLVAIRRQMPDKIGRIIIPDDARLTHMPAEADVIAISPACDSVIVGDHIVFNEYTGADIVLGGDHYLIMREEDVLARLNAFGEELGAKGENA